MNEHQTYNCTAEASENKGEKNCKLFTLAIDLSFSSLSFTIRVRCCVWLFIPIAANRITATI